MEGDVRWRNAQETRPTRPASRTASGPSRDRDALGAALGSRRGPRGETGGPLAAAVHAADDERGDDEGDAYGARDDEASGEVDGCLAAEPESECGRAQHPRRVDEAARLRLEDGEDQEDRSATRRIPPAMATGPPGIRHSPHVTPDSARRCPRPGLRGKPPARASASRQSKYSRGVRPLPCHRARPVTSWISRQAVARARALAQSPSSVASR